MPVGMTLTYSRVCETSHLQVSSGRVTYIHYGGYSSYVSPVFVQRLFIQGIFVQFILSNPIKLGLDEKTLDEIELDEK